MGFHLLLVVFDWCHLADDNFLFCSQQNEAVVEATNESLHFIFDATPAIAVLGFVLDKKGGTMKEAG